jgi:hypothetical protein
MSGTGVRRGPVAATGVQGRKRESDGVAVGRQHVGSGGTVPGGAVQTGFEIKSEFKWFKIFSSCFKLWLIRKVPS